MDFEYATDKFFDDFNMNMMDLDANVLPDLPLTDLSDSHPSSPLSDPLSETSSDAFERFDEVFGTPVDSTVDAIVKPEILHQEVTQPTSSPSSTTVSPKAKNGTLKRKREDSPSKASPATKARKITDPDVPFIPVSKPDGPITKSFLGKLSIPQLEHFLKNEKLTAEEHSLAKKQLRLVKVRYILFDHL